jgi:hypothetical protein
MRFRLHRPSGRLSLITVFLVSGIFIFVKMRQVLSTEPFIRDSYALSWDNYGYYLLLPATFIYHDPGIEHPGWLKSLNEKYQPERPFYQCWPGQKNRLVNVYPVGWAIGYAPFFGMAHLGAGWFGYARDGLSAPYQWMAIFAALFYGILGLLLMRKWLKHFFSDRLTAILILLIGLGTNLYYYASYDCNLPHIFLFAIDNGILLLTLSWLHQPRLKTAAATGFLLGLATITRPSEIVWVLVPLLWSVASWPTLKAKLVLLGKHFSHVVALIVCMIAIGSVQLIYWKYTSGHWFSFNHGEGFDFFRPFTMKVLFSYKKGWLLYTPLMIFAILGIFLLRKKSRGLFIPVLVFFIANLWFISSWECWWYAGTFSQRPFVQSYGLMALPLGVFIETISVKKFLRFSFAAVFIVIVLLNQFQVWQINRDILNRELMTGDYYWKIFGKTAVDPSWNELLEIDRGNLPPLEQVKSRYTEEQLALMDFETPSEGNFSCDTMGFESRHSLLLDAAHEYGAGFKKPFDQLSDKDHLRFRVTAEIFVTPEFAGKDLQLLFFMTGSRGQNYGYSSASFDTSQVKPGKWSSITAEYVTPHLLHSDDIFTFAIWNAAHTPVLADKVKILAFEPKVHH